MNYEIICADSLKWLEEKEDNSLGSFLTGIPDMNEVQMELDDYIKFLRKCATLIFQKMSKKGYAIFIQTDRKTDGIWVDKSFHLSHIAYELGINLMWHKIVLQREVSKIHLQRPTFSHMLCYSYTTNPSKCFADVLPIGKKEYENSTPSTASDASIEFLLNMNYTKWNSLIIDPFVGRGTIPLSLIKLNKDKKDIKFIGIDIDQKQCDICNNNLLSNNEVIKLDNNNEVIKLKINLKSKDN